MKVRSAGLKFKIANNFIWRVGHGVHHRDSTLPPYGWSSHEVNSERRFFSSIQRVEHRGVKRGDKILVLLPGTNTATSNKREPICALPALSKLAISTKRDPICALLLQSVSAVWLSCSLEQKYPPPGTELDTSNKHGSICALSAQSKSATSNKREPICAQLALSRLTTSNKLDPSAPCQSGQCDCLVQSNKLYCSP